MSIVVCGRWKPDLFSLRVIILLTCIESLGAATKQSRGDRMMVILDAFGSMWGKVKGAAKIQIAKEVLTDLIMYLPEGIIWAWRYMVTEKARGIVFEANILIKIEKYV